jgi:thiol-disulfide isomerase/thioredoxin
MVVVVSAALVGCAGSGDPQLGSPSTSDQISLPTSPEALPLVDQAGYRRLLDGLRGTPVVVNVWASWCVPCKAEAPLLSKAASDHPDIQFLGVDIQDSRDGALGFIRRYGLPYPSVFNPSADIRDALALPGQPDTLFYDATGALRSTTVGELSAASLDQGIAKIAP